MDDHQIKLDKANSIQDKIKRLESFLFYAERSWTGKLMQNAKSFFIRSNAAGYLGSKTLELDNDLKNKMLSILKVEVSEQKTELKKVLSEGDPE